MKLLIVLVLALVLANTAPDVEARGRMFNAKNVKPKQMPSLVRIDVKFREGTLLCSGTLISVECVLTAAHCFFRKGQRPFMLNVFMGSNQQNVNETNVAVNPVTANNLKIHENFNLTGGNEYDIAVFKILKVTINANINIAKLPSGESFVCESDKVIAAGWGIENKEGHRSDFAQWNYFGILPSHYCDDYFHSQYYNHQICAYEEDTSACPGDSGGPMYACGQLIGVASFLSSGDCDSSTLMVYSNVMALKDWIRANMKILK